jgi:aspartyl-tRNA(Asn)/glutamyl-tRNA(Gln) amidotransferase subunit C
MTLEEIKKLTELARIEMTDEEMLAMAGDFESILAYVGQIQEVSENLQRQDLCKSKGLAFVLENVVREDIITNEPNSYREEILSEMPETQDGYLKVKQIL